MVQHLARRWTEVGKRLYRKYSTEQCLDVLLGPFGLRRDRSRIPQLSPPVRAYRAASASRVSGRNLP